jgi:hypothetical protein
MDDARIKTSDLLTEAADKIENTPFGNPWPALTRQLRDRATAFKQIEDHDR